MTLTARVITGLIFLADLWLWRWTDRYVRPMRRARLWRRLVGCFFTVQILLLTVRLIPPAWSRRVNDPLPLGIIAEQLLWHLIILPVVLLCVLGRWIIGLRCRKVEPASTPAPAAPSSITRRSLLRGVAVAAPPVVLSGLTGVSLSQLGTFRVRAIDLPIPNLPARLRGLTIAHVSDFHAGKFMTYRHMLPVIDAVNDLQPDLVLITGDLIDYALIDLPPALDALKRLKPTYGLRDGVAMCVGNHDVIQDRFAFWQMTAAEGFPVLRNNSRTMDIHGQPLQLLGLDWCQGDRRTGETSKQEMHRQMRSLANQRDPAAFPILLAHHPHAFDDAAEHQFPITFAGHTHGGQLMLNDHFGAGPVLFRYWSGLYRKPNGSQLLVSNGIGNWFPLRANAPAEIVKVTLV